MRQGRIARVSAEFLECYDRHVRQLGLLRIMREAGHVPVEGLKQLVAATQATNGTVHELFAAAAEALCPVPPASGQLRPFTRDIADRVVDQTGWTNVHPDSPDRENLAAALEVIATYDTYPRDPAELTPYLRFADEIARYEIGHLDDGKDRVGLLEEMIVGQVVFGQVLSILRRLAEEHYSRDRFGKDRRS